MGIRYSVPHVISFRVTERLFVLPPALVADLVIKSMEHVPPVPPPPRGGLPVPASRF